MMRQSTDLMPTTKIPRFDRVERVTHWLSALIVIILVVTGVILYVPSLSAAVGRRLLIEDIHVYAGVSVVVPLFVAVAGRWGGRFRRDLPSLNRFSDDDKKWLSSLGRRGRQGIGKFNPGQKLNTFAIAGFLGVLFGTGIILRWGSFVPLSCRTGATFTHDWFALFLIVIVLGHVGMAIAHPAALKSMFTGWVAPAWVKRHAPAWRESPPRRENSDAPQSIGACLPVRDLHSSDSQNKGASIR
jgi:formate dehydrogenase subunit gamma